MQVLLALTSCCSGVGCGSAQKHMETVNKMGQRPFVIAFRSYSGSRVALLNAARDLLTAAGVIDYGGGGSDIEWYHDQERKRDFLAEAVAFKSDLPVEQILGMMAAVEERLGGPQREPAPLIKMDLLWVEGVEMKTPELTLPSPLIFDKYWANSVFVDAGEQAMFIAKNEGREKVSTLFRVAHAYKRFQAITDPAATHYHTTTPGGDGTPELARGPSGTDYDERATDDIDSLAVAGDLLLFAETDVIRGKDPKTAKDETDSDAYLTANDIVEKMPRDTVLPLQVPAPAKASVDARAQAWVNGLARLLAEKQFTGRRTMIFSIGATQISGAVIGHASPDYRPYFRPGDTTISSQRLADMPINRGAEDDVRDSRLVKLSTRYHPRPLPASK